MFETFSFFCCKKPHIEGKYCPVSESPWLILSVLKGEMLNYSKKYPVENKSHYRQARASYLFDFLHNQIQDHDLSNQEEQNLALKKIMVELYAHYLSISVISKNSTLRASLKKAITKILNIEESSSSVKIAKRMTEFTKVDLSELKLEAIRMSIEEEENTINSSNKYAFLYAKKQYRDFQFKAVHKKIHDSNIFNLENDVSTSKINDIFTLKIEEIQEESEVYKGINTPLLTKPSFYESVLRHMFGK